MGQQLGGRGVDVYEQGKTSPQSKFQLSQGHTVRPCLKTQTKTHKDPCGCLIVSLINWFYFIVPILLVS